MGQVVPIKEEPEKDPKSEWLEAFEADFWAAYPRKVGKFEARASWLKVKPWSQETLDELIQGLERWLKYWRDHDTDKEFIPYPATWLNQHRWEDEP
jgi:hypothetical protein